MVSHANLSLPIPEISCVNPLRYENKLKQLFVENGRPEYPEFFNRAYPGAVSEGAKAWIGTDEGGRVVMHASRFPHAFMFGGLLVKGGLIVNIMVAKEYRTHYPARALFKSFVADSLKEGEVDFLYTETTERGANVLTSAGASVIGRVGRFVMPIQESKPELDLALRGYQMIRGLGTDVRKMKAVCNEATAFCAERFDVPPSNPDRLRGIHNIGLYLRRVKNYPSVHDYWITVDWDDHTAAALVRHTEQNGLICVLKLSYHPSLNLAGVILSMVPVLRALECRRLQISTVVNSEFANELRRAGFIKRESLPLVSLPVSPVGRDVVRNVSKWQITHLDLDY